LIPPTGNFQQYISTSQQETSSTEQNIFTYSAPAEMERLFRFGTTPNYITTTQHPLHPTSSCFTTAPLLPLFPAEFDTFPNF
jgi:hypothetical protein